MNEAALAKTEPVTQPRRLAVIFNPVAGRRVRRRLEGTLAILRERGCLLELHETRERGHAEHLGGTVAPGDADAIVVAGGDGTINEVINGMVARRPAGAAPPLAVLPMGTANLLANEIGLRIHPRAIAETILEGEARSVVLGRANGRLFTVTVGVGFDAHVVAGTNLGLKRLIGKGAYVWETARQLGRFPYPTYRVSIDGAEHQAASVLVAKGAHYGGKFICAPRARLDAPHFQVCLFRRGGPFNVLRYAAALALGRLAALPDLTIFEGHEVLIEGPADDPVQGDGDLIARLPLSVGLLPGGLRIIMPTGRARA